MLRLRLPLIAALCALLAVPSLAGAHQRHRAFHGTFPHAAALCARTDAGHAPKKLAASTDQVKAACATLRSALTDAKTAYRQAVTPLADQGRAAIRTAVATCRQARANHDRAACRAAVRQARVTLRGLRAQVRTANKAYRAGVQKARVAFWTTIKGLRGGSSVQADGAGSATPPPAAPAIPGDAALPRA
jgi:hypothetical protein